MIQAIKSKIKFFLTKPIFVRCKTCELRLQCLGGPKCIHDEASNSVGMSLYVISISAMGTLFCCVAYLLINPEVVTKSYFFLTWISGSLYSLIAFNLYYFFKRRSKRKLSGQKP